MVGGNFFRLSAVYSQVSSIFEGIRRPGALIAGAVFMLATLVTLTAVPPQAGAWEAWDSSSKGDDWCRGCHGNFRANGATSLKLGDEAAWGGNMMSIHSSNFLNGDCNSCHGDDAGGTGKFPVFLDEAESTLTGSPQAGCMGCHGREADINSVADTLGTDAFAGNDTVPQGTLSPGNTGPARGVGAGLRQAHFTANRAMTHAVLGPITTQICIECHFDSDPANFTTAPESTVPPHYQPQISATSPSNPCNVPAGTEAMFGTVGLDNDGDGLTDQGDATATPPIGSDTDCEVNNPPTANAGPDQSVFVLSTVTLDGSLSGDTDPGDSITYSWAFVSVPPTSSATLTGPTTVNPTFVPDLPGDYTVELTVTDTGSLTATDQVIVSTQNSAPVANAGPDQSSPVFGETVFLDGSGSSDVDGDSLTYAWTWVTRPVGSSAAFSNPAAVNPTFVIDPSGTYEAQLIVNDGTVASAPDTVVITTANTAPVANAGPDQSVFVDDLVTLDGTASSDVDGDSLTYSWSFVSGPSTPTLNTADPSKPTYVADAPGTWVWQLVVNDGTAASAADTVSISTLNSAPVANAGVDQSVAQNDLVQLNGGASTDADGDSLTYSWSITSGPDAPTLSDPALVNPTFTATGVGTYTVQLIVHDGTVSSAPDTMLVSTTGNTAPVANAGPDQTAFVTDTVTLNGSGSGDPDSDPITYSWSFSSKPAGSSAALANPTTVNPNFVVDKAGSYVVQLIVNDGQLDSPPDTMTVSTLNTAPVANAGPDQSVFVDDTVLLDGSGSSDVDGDPLTYSWSLTTTPGGSGATLSSPIAEAPTFVVDLPGTYVAQLIVNDGTVNSAADTVSITTDNSAPVANAGLDQTVALNDTVLLDGSGSSDADGDTLTYSWSFSSKPAASSAAFSSPTAVNPTFVADAAGSYVVQLIVNDGTVNSAADSATISTSNTQPVANAGPDQSIIDGGLITLDGSGSFDADGDPLTYNWAFTSLPAGSTAALSSSTVVNPTFTADVPGTFTVRLIVHDGTVNSIQDTVNITNTSSASSPEVTLAPTSYDFGSVTLGTTKTGYVQVGNNGSAILTVSGLSLAGLDAADFAVTTAVPFDVFLGQSS
jgi:hypothetical protein